MSTVFPTTRNGKLSGMVTMDLERKEFFQFAILSKDHWFVMS